MVEDASKVKTITYRAIKTTDTLIVNILVNPLGIYIPRRVSPSILIAVAHSPGILDRALNSEPLDTLRQVGALATNFDPLAMRNLFPLFFKNCCTILHLPQFLAFS